MEKQHWENKLAKIAEDRSQGTAQNNRQPSAVSAAHHIQRFASAEPFKTCRICNIPATPNRLWHEGAWMSNAGREDIAERSYTRTTSTSAYACNETERAACVAALIR